MAVMSMYEQKLFLGGEWELAYALSHCFQWGLQGNLERLAHRAELRGHSAICMQIKRMVYNEEDNHDKNQVGGFIHYTIINYLDSHREHS